MTRKSINITFLTLAVVLGFSCSKPKHIFIENEVPVLWADMTLEITKSTPANSPTFASRCLGYISLAMYESVVHGSKDHQSLAGQLNGLDILPQPEKDKEYNWILSLNAAQAFILKNIYIQTSDENKSKIDSLENTVRETITGEIDNDVADRSIAYGRAIASSIFEWSKIDGGHRGYLANFDTKMQYPSGKGRWRAPFFAQTISRFPLHPHWGDNRTFLKADKDWKTPDLLQYDSTVGSMYHQQFKEVYDANNKLTQEEKEIAVWWNDDPTETYTPPGHSYNLASITIKSKKPDLITSAETYARVGLAVADAFIVCWKMKYQHFSERPSTFISEHIDDTWEPFWPDPPFPAFPSGHATQAGAVAIVLSDLFGENVQITDDTHVGRPPNRLRNIKYKERKFSSFQEVAKETAYSRFLGGIHSMQDNEVGLVEGGKVGQHVNDLKWRR
jgi:hypothetical protein